MMSFFPGSFCAPAQETSFVPLFRLLEDFDNYNREVQTAQPAPAARRQRHGARQPRSQLSTFTPKFDVRETDDTYELHGELPGLARENVHIEFTEPQTITIRGRVERTYAPDSNNNTTTESATSTPESGKSHRNSFQATVEDDPEDENTPASTPSSSPKPEAAKPASQEVTKAAPAETQKQPEPHYWRWERSVGEFSRAFTFPARVEHDGVTASLNNGILSVTVPKSKKPVSRRIEISV